MNSNERLDKLSEYKERLKNGEKLEHIDLHGIEVLEKLTEKINLKNKELQDDEICMDNVSKNKIFSLRNLKEAYENQ